MIAVEDVVMFRVAGNGRGRSTPAKECTVALRRRITGRVSCRRGGFRIATPTEEGHCDNFRVPRCSEVLLRRIGMLVG